MNLKQLGEQAGIVKPSAVSKAISRFEAQLEADAKLTAVFKQAESHLSKVATPAFAT